MKKLFLVALMAVGLSASVDTIDVKTKEEFDALVMHIKMLQATGGTMLGNTGKELKLKDAFYTLIETPEKIRVVFSIGAEHKKEGDGK